MSLCMKLDTLKAIIRAFHTASDDVTRPHITGVLVEPGKERREVIVTATNGHALSSVVCPDPELCEAMGSVNLWVSPDILPALKQLAKDYKRFLDIPVTFAGEGKSRTLTLQGFGMSVTLKSEADMGSYPDYRQVIPKMPDEPFEIGFNVELLLDLAKSLDAGMSKTMLVKLTMKDKLSPIIVTMQGNRGVLMPCRL